MALHAVELAISRDANMTSLPSVKSAEDFLLGKPGGFTKALLSTLGRSLLISVGMLAVGERKHVARNALGGAVAIELFVLWSVNKQLNEKKP